MARKRARKTPSKTPRRPGANGGQLQSGNPGNAGGAGRPASAIREHCRGSFAQRVRVLEEIADGEPIQRVRVPLAAVLQHSHCPKCGDGLQAKEAAALAMVEVDGLVSAKPKDRIDAVDTLGKYGLDARTQLSVEEVRERLTQQLTVIRATLAPDMADLVVGKLREVWST